MPDRPSAEKHLRADERKRQRNMQVKSAMRTAIKGAEEAIINNLFPLGGGIKGGASVGKIPSSLSDIEKEVMKEKM